MEAMSKLYLELANVVPPDCVSARELKLLGWLREARQYVSGAGSDEDSETQTHSRALLESIDDEFRRRKLSW